MKPLLLTNSGSSLNPLIIDGQGDVIDCGLTITKWFDKGNGTWSTGSDRFPIIDGRYAGWYKYGNTVVVLSKELLKQGDAIYLHKYKSIVIKSDKNPMNIYGEIVIPQEYAGIRNLASNLRIRNFTIRHAISAPVRNTDVSNVEYENVTVEWSGGGFSESGNFKRAGDGITFDGDTQDARVTKCKFQQLYDTGVTMQLFKDRKQIANNIEFDNNFIKQCGAGLTIAAHKAFENVITNALVRDNDMLDLGYGWSGFEDDDNTKGNATHGRGIGVKNFACNSRVEATLENNTVANYAWADIRVWQANVTQRNNKSYGYTGDYDKSKSL